MKVNYPKEAIELLTQLVGGREENAKLLAAAGFPELTLIYDSLNGNESIIPFLTSRKEFILASFLTSVLFQDKKAFDFLMKQKAPQWAATANAVNKDKNASQWLKKNNFSHYSKLADAILKKMEDDEGTGFEFLYKGPYS